ncbi:MAG: two-component sensor histidine kinase [Bacteroidetes bacterium HGW-Bacteroidetes-17]|nr:MAG: two-component sensor histidine kinase [Bacteroidetes bacterium HGW-Bacteroidetes-17]
MKIKLTFKRRLFLYLFIILVGFTTLVLVFQSQRESEFRRSQLENTLDNITVTSNKYLQKYNILNTGEFSSLNTLMDILPQSSIRITVIDAKGIVLFDSEVKDVTLLENHLSRPEIQESIGADFGANIRRSSSTHETYYYYAKFYGKYFIRTAVLYDISIINYLKSERLFWVFIIALFFIIWVVLTAVTNKFGKTIDRLKDFVIRLHNHENISKEYDFPDDELGVISRQIVEVYEELKTAKDEITLDKEKLFNHLYALNEGVAFFSSEKKKILTNNYFIQFLNIISDKSSISAEKIFEAEEFQPILNFINEYLKADRFITREQLPQKDHSLNKNGRYFDIKCIIFPDKSFEIIIIDTTRFAKRQLMKQQMTSNIAHELKTPVAAVMGYLETLQNNKLDKEKQTHFIDKAYAQAYRLKDLIEDIQVLNQIEEASGKFKFESLKLKEIIDEVVENLKVRLEENKINLNCSIGSEVIVNGNHSLLLSIFYNLIDNSLKYAGQNISINISLYSEDKNYYYFSLSDTGQGIPEEHLNRIFERFYRIDSGRSRKTGGTGLGLAIVKNAIHLHQGDISARNAKDGGLEFLFTLTKCAESHF